MGEVEKLYAEAAGYNFELVKADVKGLFENNSASFFMSAHIGLFTIQICECISEADPDWKAIEDLIRSEILRSAEHCLDDYNSPEDEILYGTAGYLSLIHI